MPKNQLLRFNFVLFVLLFQSLTGMLYAQNLRVLDADDQRPIAGVAFWAPNQAIYEVSNVDGELSITRFKGLDNIQINAVGYRPLLLSYEQLLNTLPALILSKESVRLEDLVVSATRWRQNYTTVAQAITVIDPQQLEAQQPQTMADVLGLGGKVFIQKSQQGGGSPMIRGFATNRLLYTVDGIRMNSAIFRVGNIQNVINLDPFTMERTEVLFGPSSVMYGSDAIGGVMSFETITPSLAIDSTLNWYNPKTSGRASIRSTSANNEQTGHLDLALSWQKWAWVGSVSRWNYDHLKQGSNGPEEYVKSTYVEEWTGSFTSIMPGEVPDKVLTQSDPLVQNPSGYTQWNTMQKLRWKPTQDLELNYGFHFSETSEYGRYDRHLRTRNELPRYARWDYGPQAWDMHVFSVHHRGTDRLGLYDEIVVKTALQTFKESRITRNFGSLQEQLQLEEVEAKSVQFDAIKWLRNDHILSYGAEWIVNDVQSTAFEQNLGSTQTQGILPRYPDALWSSVAMFAHSDWGLKKNLRLQMGLRFNAFSIDANFANSDVFQLLVQDRAQLNDQALVGSIGLISRPNDDWIIKWTMGTAFRAPNVDDMGKVFDSEPGAVTVPNTDLEAEYAWNADFGVAHKVNTGIKIEVNAYWTRLNNAMVRRSFLLNGQSTMLYDGIESQIQAIQNAAYARVYGAQLSVEAQISKNVRLSSSVSVQNGIEELDDGSTSPARHAAPVFGENGLYYENNSWTWGLIHRFQSEKSYENLPVSERAKIELYAKDTQGLPYAPAWQALHIHGKWELNEWSQLLIRFQNVTDQRYRPYSSGISAAGRSIQLGLNVRF